MIKRKFSNLFKALQKNAVIILLVATVCVVLTVGYTTVYSTSDYVAHCEILVHNGNLSNFSTTDSGNAGPSFTKACERIFNSDSALNYFNETVLSDRNYSTEELKEMITVRAEGRNSMFMDIKVTCDNPEDAVFLAENYAMILGDYSGYISTSLVVNTLSFDKTATLQRPDIFFLVILSFICGAVIAAVFALIFELLQNKIKSADDYKARYNERLLGEVPEFERTSKGGN